MLEILCEFLRAVVHGHFAFGEYAVHFRTRKAGELRAFTQAENTLCIQGNGKLQAEPLDLLQVWQAKRIGDIARDFEGQGL
jgi:hypothetical protein